MKEVECNICNKIFASRTEIPRELESWDCPNCTRDTLFQIQEDINYLYKTFNYKTTLQVLERIDRLWKKQYLFPVRRNMADSTTFF